MSTEQERPFTLAEAQGLVPRLKSLLGEIADEWNRIRELHPEIQKARENAPFDGFSKAGVTYVESVSRLVASMNQIKGLGVLLKDPDKGLCDFPYMRNGRMVYLCWQMGEETIGYWHDVESGFAGREPLDDTDR